VQRTLTARRCLLPLPWRWRRARSAGRHRSGRCFDVVNNVRYQAHLIFVRAPFRHSWGSPVHWQRFEEVAQRSYFLWKCVEMRGALSSRSGAAAVSLYTRRGNQKKRALRAIETLEQSGGKRERMQCVMANKRTGPKQIGD
jgi:hypothetical protein